MLAILIIIFVLFAVALIGGMTAVVVTLVKRSKNTTPKDKIGAAKQLIDKHRKKLTPWTPESFFELAWPQYRFSSKGFSMEKKMGYVRNVAGEVKLLIAYADFSAVYTKAQILIANTQTGYILDCSQEGFSLKHLGETLGQHRYNGYIFDTVGNKIGFLNRKKGRISSLEFDVLGFDVELFRKNTHEHFAFQFVSGLKGYLRNPQADKRQGSMFQFVSGTPTETEKVWLMALAAHMYFGD